MAVWKIAHNSFICTIAIPTVDIGKTHENTYFYNKMKLLPEVLHY